MSLALPQCTKCKSPLGESLFNRPELAPCPMCGTALQVEVFPALFRRFAPGRDGEILMVEGESSCFYHPEKKAVLPCQSCGRFLCALCDCELHGQHFCPACLETGQKKGKIKNLENERILYDSIALALAVLPMLFFYLTFITAPIALYVALRYWSAPRSLVRRTKVRHVIAILLATGQLIGWGIGIYLLVTNSKSHG